MSWLKLLGSSFGFQAGTISTEPLMVQLAQLYSSTCRVICYMACPWICVQLVVVGPRSVPGIVKETKSICCSRGTRAAELAGAAGPCWQASPSALSLVSRSGIFASQGVELR